MNEMKSFFRQPGNAILSIISILFASNAFLLANRKSQYSFFMDSQNPDVFYWIFFFLLAIATATLLLYFRNIDAKLIFKKILYFFAPFEIILLGGLYFWKSQLNFIFFLFAGVYLFTTSFLLLKNYARNNPNEPSETQTIKQWVTAQGKTTLALLFLIMALSGVFGNYKLAQFSAVDEPLWTFDRIPSFWKNISEKNWSNTNISDKPGITVAIISGIGLLDVNPYLYDEKNESSKNLNIEKMNYALRFPLLLFTILMLPMFYFLIERLLGAKTALLATAMIGLSPILLGMSRIINPDALLWIFAPLSILSFLIYQKKQLSAYLYLAGIFLGLAILTKYVANILYVFFFGMIFLEYIFNFQRYENTTVRKYLKCSIINFLILVIISLATFYLLYPGTWLRPDRIFKGTIMSQAFISTWPIFAAIFSLLLADTIFFKNKFIGSALIFLSKKRNFLAALGSGLFLAITAFVAFDVYAGMKFYNFEEILASPKTSYKENNFVGLLLSNFYPLIFAIIPVAVAGLIAVLGKIIQNVKSKKEIKQQNVIVFLILFIFLYYVGTTANNVVSTTRYQIMLYPLILIISSIGLVNLFEMFSQKFNWKHSFAIFSLFIVLLSSISLIASKPFYLSYASSLLPKENYLDVKDMGPGSYESAQYLNSLPDAENLTIWTDKKGVCNFFKGSCYGDLSYDELEGVSLDYVVVSWGRKSRTTSMVRSSRRLSISETFNFAKYYDQKENVIYELLINDRPGQYIKIIKVN